MKLAELPTFENKNS